MTRTPDDRKVLKETLKKLRDARGPAVQAAIDAHQEHVVDRRKIRAALAKGPVTVPELARACALPTRTVLWHLAAMRKYGELVEDAQVGDYFNYRLVLPGGQV
jgi:hypothetical protein